MNCSTLIPRLRENLLNEAADKIAELDKKLNDTCKQLQKTQMLAMGYLPDVETFSGHSYSLAEDLNWLHTILKNSQIPLIQYSGVLYNLRCAERYLSHLGIESFAADYKPRRKEKT